MIKKMKTDVDRLLLVLIMKTNLLVYFAKNELHFNFKTKSSLSRSTFIFSDNSEISETKKKFAI